jgi:hypothetical protein
MAALSMLATTVEYVHVTWTADVLLADQTVELAFLSTGQPDGNTAWLAAEWEGDPALQRACRLLVGPGTQVPLAPGTLTVFSRLHDTPEVPVRQSGQLKVT